MTEAPKVYVKEGNAIVERGAPIVERRCWWCKNPFMYEVRQPGLRSGSEIVWYQCCSCGAKVNNYETLFQSGVGGKESLMLISVCYYCASVVQARPGSVSLSAKVKVVCDGCHPYSSWKRVLTKCGFINLGKGVPK
jgi:hypothetical protein